MPQLSPPGVYQTEYGLVSTATPRAYRFASYRGRSRVIGVKKQSRTQQREAAEKRYSKHLKTAQGQAKNIEQKYGKYFTPQGFQVKTREGEYDPRQTSLLYQQYKEAYGQYEGTLSKAGEVASRYNFQSIDPKIQKQQELRSRAASSDKFERSIAEQELRLMGARDIVMKTESTISKSPFLRTLMGGRSRIAAREIGLFAHGATEEVIGGSYRLQLDPKKQITERKLETFGVALALVPVAKLGKAALGLKSLERRGVTAIGYLKKEDKITKAIGTAFKTPKASALEIPMKRTEFGSLSVSRGKWTAGKSIFGETGFKKGASPLFRKGKIAGEQRLFGVAKKDLALGIVDTTRKGRKQFGGYVAQTKQRQIRGKPYYVTASRMKTAPTSFLRSYDIPGAGFFQALETQKAVGRGSGLILKTIKGERKAKIASENIMKAEVQKYVKMGKSPIPKPVGPARAKEYLEYGLLGSGGLPPQLGLKTKLQMAPQFAIGRTKISMALKSKLTQKQKSKTKSKLKTRLKQQSFLKQSPILGIKSMSGLKSRQLQRLGLKSPLKQKQKLKMDIITPNVFIAEPKYFIFPGKFGLPKLKKSKRKKKKGIRKGKRKIAYAPTLIGTALPKSLKVKTKGLFTGLEVRRRRK